MGKFGFRAAAGTILCVFALVPTLGLAQTAGTAAKAPAQNTAGTAAKAPAPAAQAPGKNSDLQIFLDKVKADKKLLVAANMDLTEAEKTAFWPVYDAYQKDLGAINDRLAKTIRSYADAYVARTLSNDQAKKLTDEAIAIDADEAKLRSTYAAKLSSVLPATKAARYLQIENKIRAALRYDMANAIPLVP
jgi:hypothetical protein